MSFEARCPACGSPVVFGVANSLTTVCGACQSVVGRGDGRIETYGKVADLAQTDSPLQVGLRGKYKGVPFEITGRTQYRHSQGGVWDEWYVAFRDGKRWGWLAEAQGRVYLTFKQDLPDPSSLPRLADLSVDSEVVFPKIGAMRVAEIGEGELISAEGEIPFVVHPGEVSRFADLSGNGKRFATLDETDEEPVLYAGGVVTFEQLGIADAVANREKEIRTVEAAQVNCPNCGGALELRAPDETMRVACQYCGSLLDCNHGNLKFLKKLKQEVHPVLPLGTVGRVPGDLLGRPATESLEFTVIGFVKRKTVYEGTNYYWREYLLYRPRTPYCWLIHTNGHWSFGRPVEAGDVDAGAMGARCEGRSFRIYEHCRPSVEAVLGEFYWKVSVGEKVEASDYVSPPYMLSREISRTERNPEPDDPDVELDDDDDGDRDRITDVVALVTRSRKKKRKKKKRRSGNTVSEVNYTLSRYVPVEDIETWFGVENLPRPRSIAPNQPFGQKRMYAMSGLLLLAAFVVQMLVMATAARATILSQTFEVKARNSDFLVKSIELRGGRNVEVSVSGSRWVYVDGRVFGASGSGGPVRTFGLPTGRSVYLDNVTAGTYTLKLSATWEGVATSPRFSVRIRQGVPHFSQFGWLLGILLLPLILTMFAHFHHETQRWKDSDFSPYASE